MSTMRHHHHTWTTQTATQTTGGGGGSTRRRRLVKVVVVEKAAVSRTKTTALRGGGGGGDDGGSRGTKTRMMMMMGRSTSSSSSFETEAIIAGGKETTTKKGNAFVDDDDEEKKKRTRTRTTKATRRAAVATTGGAMLALSSFSSRGATFTPPPPRLATVVAGEAEEAKKSMMEPPRVQKYFASGPFAVRELPTVKHVGASVYPLCTGISCQVSVKALVPFPPPVNPDELFPKKNGSGSRPSGQSAMTKAPFPLAIVTPGFLVGSESYDFIARRLCSFGYIVLRYDKSESLNETLDDVVSASLLEDLITWASYGNGTLSNIANSEEVLLIGHSRGGKISALESLFDERVKCLALVDPVDNTQYAPLGPGFPSAVMGMESDDKEKKKSGPPATLVIGGLKGGECAPVGSNYANFFKAAQVAKKKHKGKSEEPWGYTLDCGHFDFLDEKSFIQSSVCDVGNLDDKVTKEITAAAIAFHADQTFRTNNSFKNRNDRNSDSGNGSSSSSNNNISNDRKAFFEHSRKMFGDDSIVELV